MLSGVRLGDAPGRRADHPDRPQGPAALGAARRGRALPHHQGRHRARRADRRPGGRRRHLGRRHRLPGPAAAAQRVHRDDAARRRRWSTPRTPPRSRWPPTSSRAPGWSRPGAGSGALTCTLLRAVGPTGRLLSYERREDFAAQARKNVEAFFGGPHPSWDLQVGDLVENRRATSRSTGWCSTCSRPGSASTRWPRSWCPAACSAPTSPPPPSWPAPSRPCGCTAASPSPRRRRPSVRAWHVEGLAVRPAPRHGRPHRVPGHRASAGARRQRPAAQAPPGARRVRRGLHRAPLSRG